MEAPVLLGAEWERSGAETQMRQATRNSCDEKSFGDLKWQMDMAERAGPASNSWHRLTLLEIADDERTGCRKKRGQRKYCPYRIVQEFVHRG